MMIGLLLIWNPIREECTEIEFVYDMNWVDACQGGSWLGDTVGRVETCEGGSLLVDSNNVMWMHCARNVAGLSRLRGLQHARSW